MSIQKIISFILLSLLTLIFIYICGKIGSKYNEEIGKIAGIIVALISLAFGMYLAIL